MLDNKLFYENLSKLGLNVKEIIYSKFYYIILSYIKFENQIDNIKF